MNTVSWQAPLPTGGGFVVEVSASPEVDLTTGSFTALEQSDGSVPSTVTSRTVEGLAEGPHYYHVRAKTNPQICIASAWSNVVSTIQDHTGPDLAITSPSDGHTFVGEPFIVTGTLSDALSGPEATTVTVTNTTPAVGGLFAATTKIVDASNGQWSASFPGLPTGTYEIKASGVDVVGNASAVSVISVVVVVAT